MEIALKEVTEQYDIEYTELRNFLTINSDIFYYVENEMSFEFYINKIDASDLVFLFQEHTEKQNPSTIIEDYINSFFVDEKMVVK